MIHSLTHVHQYAAALLQTHLKLHDHGLKCRAGLLLTLLFAAAARITSLSDACKRLRDAPSVEAARLALLATLPDFAETQPRLNRALAGHLPKAPLKKSKSRSYRGQWRRHGRQRLVYAFWGLKPPSFDWVL